MSDNPDMARFLLRSLVSLALGLICVSASSQPDVAITYYADPMCQTIGTVRASAAAGLRPTTVKISHTSLTESLFPFSADAGRPAWVAL